MSYDTMKRCWEAISDASLENIAATLRDLGADLGLAGTPTSALLQGTAAPHVLLAVANDYNADVGLWMIPETAIDQRLRDALLTIGGRTFAGGADLREEQWDAAVLVMAALATECADAAELAAWAEADGATVSADEIASYWNRWGATSVSEWSQLERPVTELHSFRRAM
jgi:hypothetical protein